MRGHPGAQLAYGSSLAAADRHQAAFRQFSRAASSGLPEAAYRLGRCYLLGLGVPCCPDAALPWLMRAAEAGNVEAPALLASLALQGISSDARAGLFAAASRYIGRPPDYQAALQWGRRAAEAGSAEAQTLLGYILTSGPDEIRDPSSGAQYYRLAAASGFAQGQLGWALALLRDDGSPAASATARALLGSAAAAGLPTAHFMLGVLTEGDVLAEGAPAGADQLATAAVHYRAGAELGHRPSEVRYGLALLNGRGVERDTQGGETWLRRAGLAGDAQAAAMVGDLYARQDGLPPNFCEASLWFQRAAEAGHSGAARALGQIYLRGGGFGTDPVAAARWLRVAATAGDAAAAYDLGICLAHGIGTARDDAEALQWFLRAIDAMPAARYWYGRMLAEGRGIAADLPAARACLLRAAAEGNGDAAAVAGEMLVNGRGGPLDRKAAMDLFAGAAAKGHKGAQYALDVLRPADGTPPDDTPAGAPPADDTPTDNSIIISRGACVSA